jgi:NAD(P)-dependent dehydrogenase (short-subunit alcohol dehydrogenase family)
VDTRNLQGKLAVVTGAGSGIGRATAMALGRAGADLAVCDVDADGLAGVERDLTAIGRTVLARRVDVSRRDEMAAFAEAVHRDRPAVDVLVNNAGVGLGAAFLETSLEDWEWVLGINLWGVILGCHYFVPRMVERAQGGHVVNVASSAAFQATTNLHAYSTTKYAVFGHSEALREELRPHGIGVTVVCPGVINTNIGASGRMRGLAALPGARERMVADMQRRNYGPERVASAIMDAIAANRAVLPVAPEAWVLWWVKRLAPGLATRIVRALQARMEREIRRNAATR